MSKTFKDFLTLLIDENSERPRHTLLVDDLQNQNLPPVNFVCKKTFFG